MGTREKEEEGGRECENELERKGGGEVLRGERKESEAIAAIYCPGLGCVCLG